MKPLPLDGISAFNGAMSRGVGLAAAALVMLGAVTGCSSSDDKPDPEAASLIKDATQSMIRYEVTGDTTMASLTYQTPSGSSQASNIDIPLTVKSTGAHYLEMTFSPGAFVYLSAQNSEESGSVTCRITTEDGDVISENTASGGFAIATCQGQAR